MEIKSEWLLEVAPHVYSKSDLEGDNKKMPKGQGKGKEVTQG
jgi:hypothetical protein